MAVATHRNAHSVAMRVLREKELFVKNRPVESLPLNLQTSSSVSINVSPATVQVSILFPKWSKLASATNSTMGQREDLCWRSKHRSTARGLLLRLQPFGSGTYSLLPIGRSSKLFWLDRHIRHIRAAMRSGLICGM